MTLAQLPDSAFIYQSFLLVIAVTSILANVAAWRRNRPQVELKQPVEITAGAKFVTTELCDQMHAQQEQRFAQLAGDIEKLWSESSHIKREHAEARALFERALGRIEGKLDQLLTKK